MIRILLSGSEGKMGGALKDLILKDEHLKLEVSFDKKSLVSGFEALETKNIDAVLDFSSPELFSKMLFWAKTNGIPLISGTTGLSQEMRAEMKECSQEIPLFWASNMSFGVALLMEVLKIFSKCREEFDFQIEEIHHKHKKDQPSGTALSLQEKLHSVVQKNLPKVLSVRGGGVYGIHKVWALAEGETLSFQHTAMNRKIFAQGALKAVKWTVSQKPGFYGMEDLFSQSFEF